VFWFVVGLWALLLVVALIVWLLTFDESDRDE